jgi:hypothetical protein
LKINKLLSALALLPILSGCVIWSFYPFYTEKDIFENDILTGKWIDEDSLVWNFIHPIIKNGSTEIMNKKVYDLNLTDYDNKNTDYSVNLFKLDNTYFLDFYVQQIESLPSTQSKSDVTWWSLHVMPVHTIAKLTMNADTLNISWFDIEWLKNQLKEKKIKIKHEDNGESVLLTAKTADLQKMIRKYADSEDAFKDAVKIKLVKSK